MPFGRFGLFGLQKDWYIATVVDYDGEGKSTPISESMATIRSLAVRPSPYAMKHIRSSQRRHCLREVEPPVSA